MADAGTGTGAGRPKATGRRRLLIALWITAGFAVLGVAALAISMPITDTPSFCPTCHEMTPYNRAWAVGPHSKVSCLDCHIDRGAVAHVLHKFVALQEVVSHFAGGGTFPKGTADIPDARCTSCHPTQRDTLTGSRFTHSIHAGKVACFRCHLRAGHTVSDAALAAFGALDSKAAATQHVIVVGASAARVTTGQALPSHKTVVCAACHDMVKADCALCHRAGHAARTAPCGACHKPGTGWTFSHPAAGVACGECHNPPAGHFSSGCDRCHRFPRPFKQATFTHPPVGKHSAASFPCKTCHPNGFATADCTTCHKNGPPSD